MLLSNYLPTLPASTFVNDDCWAEHVYHGREQVLNPAQGLDPFSPFLKKPHSMEPHTAETAFVTRRVSDL